MPEIDSQPQPGATTIVVHGAAAGSAATSGSHHGLFSEILSDLNPLQYVPIVGSIYRAVTGDMGNETLRFVGSLATSAAFGGPLGIGITVLEKVTGIDPEKIAFGLLGIGGHAHYPAATPAATSPSPTLATAAATPVPASAATPAAWSPSQLKAYGVTRTAQGSLVGHGLQGADVLNDLELSRLHAG